MKPEERAKDVSQSETVGQLVRSETPKRSVRSREAVRAKQRVSQLVRSETSKRSVRSREAVRAEQRVSQLGVKPRSGQLGVRLRSMESRQSSEDDEEMSQHIW